MDVAEISTGDVLRVLEPIWFTRSETASRIRMRIEAILNWAISRGYRSAENAARWRGHLATQLPHPKKVKPVKNQPSLDYAACPEFMRDLRKVNGLGARCLELTILLATRVSESSGAQWDEVNLERKEWIVPAIRTKTGRPLRIPLPPAAAKLLEDLPRIDGNPNVFPGIAGRPLTPAAPYKLAKELAKGRDVSVHGFRASFRSWSGDRTNFPREVAEACLGHAAGSSSEAAYIRTDMIERRRKLLDAWAAYLESDPASTNNVTAINGAKSAA
jgi:integrase